MDYSIRQFIIFNLSEIDTINFEHVLETSKDTVRKSNDGIKAVIKWDGPIPYTVEILTTKEGPYTYQQIKTILDSPEWESNDNIDKFINNFI